MIIFFFTFYLFVGANVAVAQLLPLILSAIFLPHAYFIPKPACRQAGIPFLVVHQFQIAGKAGRIDFEVIFSYRLTGKYFKLSHHPVFKG